MQTADEAIQRFLRSISARIPDEARAAELRLELLDHLECKIEFFTSCGFEQNQAVEEAISEMGDTDHVAEQMGSIHSRVPHLDMKNALNRVVFGLLLQLFSIDIGLLHSLMTIIGMLLVLSGMLQIRNTHAKLSNATRVAFIQCFFQAAVFLLSVAPIMHIGGDSDLIIGLITGVIQIIFLSALGRGLSELIVSSSGGFTPPEFSGIETKIRKIGILYLVIFVLALIGTFDQGMSSVLVIPFIILTIMILSRLLKTMRFLLIQQFGSDVEEIRKPVWIGLACAGVLVLVLPWITTIILFSIPTSLWQKATFSQSEQVALAAEQIGQDEVDNITRVFSENDVNMEILQILPASEIARLDGLVEIYSLIQSVNVQDGDLENHSLILVKDDGTAEAIQWFKWIEAPKNAGWDTVFLPRGHWYFSETETNSRVYILSGDENNMQMQKPVRIQPGNQPMTVSGEYTYKEYNYFDYAVAKEAGQTVTICSTVDEWLASNIIRYGGSGNSNLFSGCVYISRDKFKPHSYSTSLELASLVSVT